MSSRLISISALQARSFLLRAHGFGRPLASVGEMLARHGAVQIDPINVCGRMHDLILRNRIAGYREGDLLRHLYGDNGTIVRRGFEHYSLAHGVLSAFPLDAWPYFAGALSGRAARPSYFGRPFTRTERKLADRILAEIGERGPLTSDEIQHDGRAITAWGTSGRIVKTVLEGLYWQGRVLISTRRGFRRVYDLPERVLPAGTLNAAPPGKKEAAQWAVLLKLRQGRLVRLKKQELALVEDRVQRFEVDDRVSLYCLPEDVALLDATDDVPLLVALLAPLDPIIYDRRATSVIWNFDYTWEVYTPAVKRVRGYYALPVLSRGEIVGHVDPKAHRRARKLEIVSRRVKRGHAIASAVRDFARFLGLPARS